MIKWVPWIDMINLKPCSESQWEFIVPWKNNIFQAKRPIPTMKLLELQATFHHLHSHKQQLGHNFTNTSTNRATFPYPFANPIALFFSTSTLNPNFPPTSFTFASTTTILLSNIKLFSFLFLEFDIVLNNPSNPAPKSLKHLWEWKCLRGGA